MTDRRRIALAGHAGDVGAARAALGHTDPVVRELALSALRRSDALTADDLASALDDHSPAVRRRVATMVAHLELTPERASEMLLPLLGDADTSVAETAAWAAGEREQVSVALLDQLISMATDADDALIREASIAALGAIGDQRALPAILAGCEDKPAIRRRAVLALAPFDEPRAIEAMRVALVDRDWQVRQSAEDVLRAAGLDATPSPATDNDANDA